MSDQFCTAIAVRESEYLYQLEKLISDGKTCLLEWVGESFLVQGSCASLSVRGVLPESRGCHPGFTRVC